MWFEGDLVIIVRRSSDYSEAPSLAWASGVLVRLAVFVNV